jgi:hypothetical protein
MPFEAEQLSYADEPTRLFLMRACLFGVPAEAFHRSLPGTPPCRLRSSAASLAARTAALTLSLSLAGSTLVAQDATVRSRSSKVLVKEKGAPILTPVE